VVLRGKGPLSDKVRHELADFIERTCFPNPEGGKPKSPLYAFNRDLRAWYLRGLVERAEGDTYVQRVSAVARSLDMTRRGLEKAMQPSRTRNTNPEV
jgi:hypothetical protein